MKPKITMNKTFFQLSMRSIMTLLVVAELSAVVVISWLATWLFRYLGITVVIPEFVWFLVISIGLGFVTTFFLGKWLFDPVTKLGNAMAQVAEGNFNVRLEGNFWFKEINDIYTSFNLMAGELGATEILQTDFVSNVSHEFKTPINAIEGYATLLQGCDPASQVEQRRYVEKILFNTRRLSKLVGNILLLSKVDNQAIQTKPTTFRLDEQIRQSIVMLEPEWANKDIEFDVDMERIAYTGIENLLMHVWNNLIGNAIKFDPPGGFVGIRLKKEQDTAVFILEDSGPGIPEDSRNHIFDKFYQIDSSHRVEGNGLGLALVKQILEVCGGSVFCENRTEGGCRFTVSLPMK